MFHFSTRVQVNFGFRSRDQQSPMLERGRRASVFCWRRVVRRAKLEQNPLFMRVSAHLKNPTIHQARKPRCLRRLFARRSVTYDEAILQQLIRFTCRFQATGTAEVGVNPLQNFTPPSLDTGC
jgi:hypothetical protein